MMSSVLGQVCSALAPMRSAASQRSARSTAAAAPSPNSAEEITSALVLRSLRKASEQVSTTTTSTTSPGSARASRAPSARPDTPPAQPSPNTGTRVADGSKAHLRGHARFQARRRDAGRGHGDDHVDVARVEAGAVERRARGAYEQFAGAVEIGRRAIGPVVRRRIPFKRAHRVAPFDAGIGEDIGELGIAGEGAGIDAARERGDLRLRQPNAAAPRSPAPAMSPASCPCQVPSLQTNVAPEGPTPRKGALFPRRLFRRFRRWPARRAGN